MSEAGPDLEIGILLFVWQTHGHIQQRGSTRAKVLDNGAGLFILS